MGLSDKLTCLLRKLYAGQEAAVRTMEQSIGSELGIDYVNAIYYHPAYLTSVQSISCEMWGWMTHRLESRLPGEISTTSGIQMISF